MGTNLADIVFNGSGYAIHGVGCFTVTGFRLLPAMPDEASRLLTAFGLPGILFTDSFSPGLVSCLPTAFRLAWHPVYR